MGFGFSNLPIKTPENEAFGKCPISFKFKEGENFNRRNTRRISKIKILAC